jgi:capsular exopolysaccharide synthesis family protein
MYDVHDQSYEPTVLGAAWQYRWLVLFLSIAFAGLGWLYGSIGEAWTATATINVEDPRATGVFDQAFVDIPERYVQGQAEIAGSRTVAHRTVDILAQLDTPIDADIEDIDKDLGISVEEISDQIAIIYTAPTEAEAIAVVNAVVIAYEGVASEASEARFASGLEQLDRGIVSLEAELLDFSQQIDDLRNNDPSRLALEAELDVAIARLLAFQPTSPNATPEEAAAQAVLLTEIGLQVTTLQDAIAVDVDDPAMLGLLDQQAAARTRLGDLQTVRDQLAVDAELAGNGVAFSEPAEAAVPASAAIMLVLGLLGGGILGGSIALLLARRRRRFSSRSEPERVLGVRLLADVPSFFEERIDTSLPVVEAPASASAESFRFVSSAIVLQQERSLLEHGTHAFKTLIMASPTVSEGKTIVTANTAYAAALAGKKVLVIDADLGNQELTRMLQGSVTPEHGLTDVIRGSVKLEDAVVTVSMEHAGSVDLLARGSEDGRPSDVVSSKEMVALLAHLSEVYDLVLIDSPPLLQVAYSTTLVRLADRALVVISHGQDIHGAEDLKRSIDMIGTPMLGYVYNQAPLRREMALRSGSVASRRAELEEGIDTEGQQLDQH